MESNWRYNVTALGFNLWGATKVARVLSASVPWWVSDEPAEQPQYCIMYFQPTPLLPPPFSESYFKSAVFKEGGSFSPFPYGRPVTDSDH